MTVSLNDLSAHFEVPDKDFKIPSPAEALAWFLESIKFTMTNYQNDSEILKVGKNIFAQFLPLWYIENDEAYSLNPGDVWVLITDDSSADFRKNESKRRKQTSFVRVEIHHGNRDVCNQDAFRLHWFFLRPENAVQFEFCRLSVRRIVPIELPSLVGEDESSRSVYSFRLEIQSIITST